jgi:hypothetical protein
VRRVAEWGVDWLAGPANRWVFVLVLGILGVVVGLTIRERKHEDARADQERRQERRARARGDAENAIRDRALAAAISRLEELEEFERAPAIRLLRRLNPAQARELGEIVGGNELGAPDNGADGPSSRPGPPPAAGAPQTPPSGGSPGAPAPGSPGAPESPGPGPAPGPMLDVGPLDPDGPGGLPPIDLPPVEFPRPPPAFNP